MQVKLQVLEGSQAGKTLTVKGPKFLVGRDADCHLRPRSDLISRHHCVLIVEPGYCAVRDFNSKNGTFVNGVRIDGECQLKTDDELTIGPLRFSVNLEHTLAGPKRSKVHDVKEALERTAERASDDEFDVSGWLEGGDEDDQGDTRHNIPLPLKASNAAAKEKQDHGTETTRHTSEEAKTSRSKFTQEAVGETPKSQDTRSAAAEVLRKLREQKSQKDKK
jgi:pSer/pThr/pTyr-binding forkhead associated (FHA) protein